MLHVGFPLALRAQLGAAGHLRVLAVPFANGGVVLPRGCMVRYREWYGMRPGEPKVGLKLHAEEVGKGIAEREQGESIAYGVLDPSAFKEDGGPSIAERIAC